MNEQIDALESQPGLMGLSADVNNEQPATVNCLSINPDNHKINSHSLNNQNRNSTLNSSMSYTEMNSNDMINPAKDNRYKCTCIEHK